VHGLFVKLNGENHPIIYRGAVRARK
jgi:hypothetical protein